MRKTAVQWKGWERVQGKDAKDCSPMERMGKSPRKGCESLQSNGKDGKESNGEDGKESKERMGKSPRKGCERLQSNGKDGKESNGKDGKEFRGERRQIKNHQHIYHHRCCK